MTKRDVIAATPPKAHNCPKLRKDVSQLLERIPAKLFEQVAAEYQIKFS